MSIQDSSYVAATLGACDVKITVSTQGVAVECDAKLPREAGESLEDTAKRSAEWALMAFDAAVKGLAERDLVPGPYAKKATP